MPTGKRSPQYGLRELAPLRPDFSVFGEMSEGQRDLAQEKDFEKRLKQLESDGKIPFKSFRI